MYNNNVLIIIERDCIDMEMEENESYKKKPVDKKRKILSLSLIIISIAIVVYVIVDGLKGDAADTQKYSFITVFNQWMRNWPYFLFALLLYFIAILLETLKISLMIRSKTKKMNLKIALKTTILGKYYDNITPLGSGGQPFQIYQLKKSGLTGGQAGSIPIVSFFLSRLGFTILCLLAFIIAPAKNIDNTIRIMAYIGCAITFFVPFLIILLSLFPHFMAKVCNSFVSLLSKMHFIKNKEEAKSKITSTLESYSDSIKEYRNNKITLVVCFFLSIAFHITICSIPYFIVKASIGYGELPVHDVSYIQCLSLGLYAYASVTYIPTPGTAGAAEFSFSKIFEQFLRGGFLVYGMLYWRVITFYLVIIVGLIITIVSGLKKKHSRISTASNENLESSNYGKEN